MLYSPRKALLQILPLWTFIRIWASNQDPRFRTLSKCLMTVSPMIIDSIDVFSSCWRVLIIRKSVFASLIIRRFHSSDWSRQKSYHQQVYVVCDQTNESNQFKAVPTTPKSCCKIFRRMECSMVSIAALRSKSTRSVTCLLSILIKMSFWTFNRAVSVEWYLRKPDRNLRSGAFFS